MNLLVLNTADSADLFIYFLLSLCTLSDLTNLHIYAVPLVWGKSDKEHFARILLPTGYGFVLK